ncbi:unnamed protein product [Pseudo-nitzschia multistriata]|uniref:Uncharacterized protein n=1 Tax=Pseudo-nitzschia multistriata TaxID=183589 RepID=A0A448ZH64_9STRA|nr:unnamed protein product [Pseudo-nitzschia multistriata]
MIFGPACLVALTEDLHMKVERQMVTVPMVTSPVQVAWTICFAVGRPDISSSVGRRSYLVDALQKVTTISISGRVSDEVYSYSTCNAMFYHFLGKKENWQEVYQIEIVVVFHAHQYRPPEAWFAWL